MQVAPFALGTDRLDTAAVAFVTDDGDVLFGDEAEARGTDRPERLIREFIRDIGDRTPLVVGGFAVGAAELFARLVHWSIGVVAAAVGARPDSVAITHPTGWRAHRLASIRTALHDQGLEDVLLVPGAVVAAERAADAVRGRLIGVYDLGGGTFEASILRGTELLGPPVEIDAGGNDLDHALMRHVLASVGVEEHLLRKGASAAVAGRARHAVVAARERLSSRADSTMTMTLEERELRVRLTRYELDALAAPTVEQTVDALDLALAGAHVEAAELDEIVLVGGAARTPLVAQKVSERFDRPINAPDEPQLTAVLGAAGAAWTRLQRIQPVLEPLSAPEPTPEERPEGFTRPRGAGRPRRAPYGAAAALAAGAVLVAAGVVFGSATPLGDPTGGGKDSYSDSEGDRAAGARSARTVAGYSTGALDPASTAENGPGAAPSRDQDRGSLDRGERAPRTPQPVDSATDTPSRSSGSGAAPTTGGAVAPSGGSGSPSQTEDPVSPAAGDAQPEPSPEPTPGPVPQPTADPAPDPTPDPAPEPEPTPSDPPVEPPPAETPPPIEETAPPSSADAPPGTAAP